MPFVITQFLNTALDVLPAPLISSHLGQRRHATRLLEWEGAGKLYPSDPAPLFRPTPF